MSRRFYLLREREQRQERLYLELDQILGDYACSAEPETLMSKNRGGGGPNGDVARLKGARLVRAANLRWDTG